MGILTLPEVMHKCPASSVEDHLAFDHKRSWVGSKILAIRSKHFLPIYILFRRATRNSQQYCSFGKELAKSPKNILNIYPSTSKYKDNSLPARESNQKIAFFVIQRISLEQSNLSHSNLRLELYRSRFIFLLSMRSS